MKKVEYSQIVRRKLKVLRGRLTSEFGSEVSRKSLKQITDAARSLEKFAERGVAVSECMILNVVTDTSMWDIIICFIELRQIRLSLQKCSMIGKILCISCLVFRQYHKSP